MYCSGIDPTEIEQTSCSIPIISGINSQFEDYADYFLNVRITAVNRIGKSETSLPIFPPSSDTRLIEFGDDSPWTNVYSIDKRGGVHITQINFKQKNNKFEFSGMQLVFSNGDQTPMMEVEDNDFSEFDDEEAIKIVSLEDINYVYLDSINMQVKNNRLLGLELIDEQKNAVAQSYQSINGAQVIRQELDDDEAIIGLMCNT